MAEISDPAKKDEPTAASVMDYLPVNINPTGPQSAYYTTTIGPYDYGAIEYGYKVINGDENAELAKIASRSGEPGLDYGTDEDTRGTIDPDPLSNRFDLGKDPVEYATRQMKLTQELMPKVVERTVKDGEGYQRARQAFGLLLREFSRTANFVARLPGGVEVRRDHKGDVNGRAPFQAIPAAQQRAGVKLLTDVAFASPKIDTKVINSLSSTRWYHWGIDLETRNDYPIFRDVEFATNAIAFAVAQLDNGPASARQRVENAR